MKILLLTESLKINETSSGIVSSTFIEALSQGNNDITCLYENSISYPITWLKGVNLVPVNYSYRKNFIETIPKIRAIPTYILGYNIEFRKKIDSWKKEIKLLLNKEKYDLIITLGSGSSFLPHYAMLGINTKIPWMANFHDPYPLSLYPEPYTQKRNVYYFHQERFTKRMIEKATYVSFPSLYLKNWMAKFFPLIEDKFLILPHLGVELQGLPSKEEDEEVYLNKEKFNILHAGTLLGPRKTDALFNAFQAFISKSEERKDKTILSVLGKVAREHKNIAKNHSNNINVITKRVSYKHSLELMKLVDVSLVIEADSDFSPFMPGKLADLIYLEKTIMALTPKNSETIRILGEDYRYQARIDNEQEILTVLEQLWEDWNNKRLALSKAKELKKYISVEEFNSKIKSLKE